MSDVMMYPGHPRWTEFVDVLAGPSYCDFQDNPFTWKCQHDHSQAEAILRDMGFLPPLIEESVQYFEEHGGFCDCEILFNVAEA